VEEICGETFAAPLVSLPAEVLFFLS